MEHLARDIEVEIEFLHKEDGGRENSTFSGYRPQFFYNGNNWDAVLEYIDVEKVTPGQKVKAYTAFLSPQKHNGSVYPYMPFLIREGNRIIGFGTVIRIIDLPASAAERMRELE